MNFTDSGSIVDMVAGLVGLGLGIVTYIPAGIGLAITKVTGDVPELLENTMKITKGYNEKIGKVLKDPALMVEGVGQNISDVWEEKGVAYCTGYATGEVLQAVVLKKISASKLNKVDDARIISKSDIIIKGKNINVAETLTRLGVSNKKVTSTISKLSIDDLKKLYVYLEKNPSGHKTNRVIDKILKGDSVDDVIKGVSKVDNLWMKSACNNDELYNYLIKNVNEDVANKFLKEGKWPDGIQIPKNSSVVNPDGSINWSKAAEGGYTLTADGKAIKQQFKPQIGEVIDRYGNANGRYTSPVINGEPYSYTKRSLPYVEDLSNYHQYEVVGDFNKLEDYVKKCSDIKLKNQIDAAVTKYYDGDYSNLISYKGEIAGIKGWGTGGGIQYELSINS